MAENNLFAPPTQDEMASAKQATSSLFSPPSQYEMSHPPQGPSGFLKQTGHGIVNSLPAIGGVIGGALGTPADALTGPAGTVGGAFLGGYAGTAAKNLINHYIDPQNSPQNMEQVVAQPMIGGAGQATAQTIGNAVAPYVGKLFGKLSDKGAENLEDLANQKTIEATGATGKESQGFQAGAAKALRDQGIVRFGNSQQTIAKKAADALEKAGEQTGSVLSDLDSKGATVDQADIISSIRQRASKLGEDPSQFGVSDQLNRLADRLQTVIESKGGNSTIPLKVAENTKRGFQYASNYANSSPHDITVAKEAANIYRQAVEDAATKFDPASGETFQAAKKTWGLLSPIAKATAKRAATLNQSPAGGLLDTATTAAGAAMGGGPGAVIAPLARRAVASRIAPSMAAIYGGAANLVGAIPGAAQSVTPAVLQALPSQYGLMAPVAPTPPQTSSYSTIPGRNGQ